MSPTYRTFIAIELPPDIRRCIKEYIDQLRAAFRDVRASWAREDNLHLTLKFLGDVPVKRIPALSDAAAAAAHDIKPFDLVVMDCGTFPAHGRPKVLWIGAGSADIRRRDEVSTGSDSDRVAAPTAEARSSQPPIPSCQSPLTSLHATLETHCAAAGFEREPRSFHPHLTIARLRDSKGSRALAEHHKQLGFVPQTFTVSELILFRSELSSKGSKHTALARHELV